MKILLLIDRKFPLSHAFLETVYLDILNNKGYDIVFVLRSSERSEKKQEVFHNNVKFHVLPNRGGLGLLKYAVHLLDIQALVSLIRVEKPDIIHVRNDPIMALIAAYFKWKYSIPFVFQLSFLKEEQAIYQAQKKLYGNRVSNYMIAVTGKLLRTLIFNVADLIFPISDCMQTYLLELGVPDRKMVSIPLGGDTQINLEKISVDEVIKEHELQDNKVLIYLGDMSKIRNPEFILYTFALVRRKIPNVKLLMVGEGREPEDLIHLKSVANNMGLQKDVIFTGQISRSQVPKYIKAADIGLSPIPPTLFYEVSSPTKLMEYLTFETPVVCNIEIPEQKKIILESHGGVCVDYSEESFARAILDILSNPNSALNMGKSGRDYIIHNRSYNILALKVEKEYLKLLRKKKQNGSH